MAAMLLKEGGARMPWKKGEKRSKPCKRYWGGRKKVMLWRNPMDPFQRCSEGPLELERKNDGERLSTTTTDEAPYTPSAVKGGGESPCSKERYADIGFGGEKIWEREISSKVKKDPFVDIEREKKTRILERRKKWPP